MEILQKTLSESLLFTNETEANVEPTEILPVGI